jgi:hypothetical protein
MKGVKKSRAPLTGQTKMLYLGYDDYEGRAARLYRSPVDITLDIKDIRRKIGEIGERLNFSNVIAEMLCHSTPDGRDGFISELDSLLYEARGTINKLDDLNGMLCELAEELDEVRRVIN